MTPPTHQAALEGLFVPVDSIQTHPSNPRLGDIGAIAQSLEHFGQVRPIVVQRETGYIIAGNHTYLAAKQLGWEEIAALKIDLSEEDAKRYLLADNRASDKGVYDDEALIGLLQLMMDAGHLEHTGYTPDDVDDLIAEVGVIAETVPQEFEGGYADTPEQREARTKDYTNAEPMREVVLIYPTEDYAALIAAITQLRKLWGIESTRGVVKEAISRAVVPPPMPRSFLEAPGLVEAVAQQLEPDPDAPSYPAAEAEARRCLEHLATVMETQQKGEGE